MFREHADHPSAIYGKATPLVDKEFTKSYLTPLWLKANDDVYDWLAGIIHNIRKGNYDVILPRDLSTIKHGAVLICKDGLDGPTTEWSIIDCTASSSYSADNDRRNYIIHVVLPTFIESLVHSCLARTITPAQPGSITPTKMNTLKAILNDLCEIARQNADPTIPFENRLDGNRDLHMPCVALA